MSSPRSSTLLIVLAYVGFVSLGLPDGLLGVATPSIRASFLLAPEDLGALLIAFTAGYLTSSFASGGAVARLGVGALLAASCLATGVSLLGYATATAWWAMLAWSVLSGLGAGAIDAGLNTWVATYHGPRTVNWLHACYGVGATTGPLVMTAVLASGRPWRLGYALVGAGQLVLALGFAATRRRWSDPSRDDARERASVGAPVEASSDGSVAVLATLRLPAAWLGAACFFLYTGIEATTGIWTFSMLTQARGVPVADAGTWVSAFWAGLMAGRFAFGFVAERVSLATLLRTALAAIVLGALLLASGAGAVASAGGLVLCGVAMAPIFPSMIASTPARVGRAHTANTVGVQVAGATLGASLVPAATGVIVGALGLEAVAPTVVVGALLLALLHELLLGLPPRA
jgi:fucose permease